MTTASVPPRRLAERRQDLLKTTTEVALTKRLISVLSDVTGSTGAPGRRTGRAISGEGDAMAEQPPVPVDLAGITVSTAVPGQRSNHRRIHTERSPRCAWERTP